MGSVLDREEHEPHDEMAREYEREKARTLSELRAWIEHFSEEEMNQYFLVLGPKTFTPHEILHEVEQSTGWGRYIVRMWTEHRLELARKNITREE